MSAQAFLAWWLYLARLKSKRARLDWGAFGLAIQFMCITSAPLLLQYGLLWFIKSYCHGRNTPPSSFLAYSLATSLLIFLAFGMEGIWAAAELRQRYPMESLAARLEYESPTAGRKVSAPFPHHLRPAPEDNAMLARPELALDVDALYGTVGATHSGRSRTESLQRLHESYLVEFINSPGFGYGRMTPIRFPRVNLYREETPGQPSALVPADSTLSAGAPAAARRAPEDDLLTQLLPLHKEALVDFTNPEGFGWVQDREHVAGFEPHAFSNLPQHNSERRHRPPQWCTLRVELVSLLKHQQPMVYVSEKLPNMAELKDAPVRPLTSFERRALSALQYEHRDLVGEMTGDKLHLVGSIRAGKTCLECHQVPHGELLGAFSYELLDQLNTQPAPPEAPKETL